MNMRWCGQPRWSILLLLHLVVRVLADGPAITYCSTENNAGAYQAVYNFYQSTGLCSDHCTGSYAFAIVQGYNCWCSNYIPASQEDTYNCNQPCPGTGNEWCGNTDTGLYGYFQIPAGNPLGTSGSPSSGNAPSTSSSVSTTRSSSSSSSPSPSAASRPSPTSLVTVGSPQSSVQAATPSTVSSVPASSTYHPAPSTYLASSASYTSLSSSDSSTTSTPVPTEIYTSYYTVTGRVSTVIVTPSPTASSDATLGQSSTSGGQGVSTGKIVGIVLGVAIGIGLIIGLLVWLWFRRKRRQEAREDSPEGSFVAERSGNISSGANSVPSRQVSQMSTSGLLGKPPRIMTNGLMGGSDLRSADTNGSGFDRRSVGTDQRLNPWALYSQEDRMSNVSLQDNQDYSRQLKIANPDQ